MKISFGMIFSIILVIVFLAFAFFGIQKFLSFQKEIKYTQFSEDLKSDVERIWKSTKGSEVVEYSLPKEVSRICFVKSEFGNLEYRAKKPRDILDIDHIDIEKSLNGESSLCFENIDQRVKFQIEKDYREKLVTVLKV